jgi:hypothetical protein
VSRRPSLGRALLHVLLAGGLGVLAALAGAPFVFGSLFGGGTVFVITVLVVVGVVSAAAVGLDLAAGPGRGGRGGSVLRGLVLGVLGTVTAVVLAFSALRFGWADGITVPLAYASAALPFAAVAALQWRGVVRIVSAVALLVAAGIVVVPRLQQAVADSTEQKVVTEVGTTEYPWVTEIGGLEGRPPQTTGSGYIPTPYVRPGESFPSVSLMVLPDGVVPGGDPCAGEFFTPEGTFVATSCSSTDGVIWQRVADTYWQQLVTQVDGTWLGAAARPDVPRALLEEALRNARPMTDAEYESWLDEILPE